MNQVVACAGYEDGKRVVDLDITESGAFGAGPNRFVWIGLHEPRAELLKCVQEQFGLHELAVEDALRAHQRPKIDIYGESLFMVLRTAQLIGDKVEFGETHIFVGHGYVISVRHGASSSYTEVRNRSEATPRLLKHGEDFVLYAIMDFVVDNYLPIVDAIQDQAEEIENAVRDPNVGSETIERIAQLRHDLMQLRRTAAPLLEVCNRMQRLELPCIDDAIRPYFRDVHDHVIHVNEGIDIIRDILRNAFETHLLMAQNRQNAVTRQLAGWAAILAVPTAIAGIYGMNFEHIPELQSVWGYPAVLAVIIVICLALYTKFRRMGWL